MIESVSHEHRDHFLWQAYGQAGTEAQEFLLAMGSKFTSLMADPGVVFHLEELKSFTHGKIESFKTAEDLREAFAKYLGKKKIYRAVYINQSELGYIVAHGMPSHYVSSGSTEWASPQESVGMRTMGLPPEYIQQLQPKDISLSVTDYPEIAAAVTYQDSLARQKADHFVVLFEIEVPVLDLAWPGQSFLHGVGSQWGRSTPVFTIKNLTPKIQQTLRADEKPMKYGRDVESFVFYKIFPDEIKGYRIVPDKFEYDYETHRQH